MGNNEATAKAEFCQRVLSGEIEWVAATIWLDGLTLDEMKRLHDDCIVHNTVQPMIGGNISHRRQRVAEYLKQRIGNKEQQQQRKENSEQQQQSDKPKLITGLCDIASYMGISVNTLRTAIKNGYYNGIIYRVGNSKWQIDTEKYEQSKFNKQ